MDWLVERRERLFVRATSSSDHELLRASLQAEPDQRKGLAQMVEALGWARAGGPQSLEVEALSQAPTLATCVSHDEDGRPRWLWAFDFREAETTDWRQVLLKHGKVAFTRIA